MSISAIALRSQADTSTDMMYTGQGTSTDLRQFLLCQNEFSMLSKVRAKRLNPPTAK